MPGSVAHKQLYLLALDTGTVEVLQPVRLDDGDERPLEFAYGQGECIGRGPRLYLHDHWSLYAVDLGDIL